MNAYNVMKRAAVAAVLLLVFVVAPSAGAAYAPSNVWVKVIGSDGTFTRQAGAHADLETHLEFPRTEDPNGGPTRLDANVKDVLVDLPPGVTGNPTSATTCSEAVLTAAVSSPLCPVAAQIGVARVQQSADETPTLLPIYNIQRSQGVPGLFGFNFLGVPVFIKAQVRPGDYGISALSAQISQAHPIFSADITLWGVPGDTRHDPERFDPNLGLSCADILALGLGLPCPTAPPATPFLSMPTSCSDAPSTTTISTDFWQDPGNFSKDSLTTDVDGTPLVTSGCDKLDFRPTASVQPLSHTVDAPTGLDVNIHVPQNDSPTGLATAHVRKVSVVLPQGMSVSPSSAAGLGACSPEQVKIGHRRRSDVSGLRQARHRRDRHAAAGRPAEGRHLPGHAGRQPVQVARRDVHRRQGSGLLRSSCRAGST